MQIEAEHTTSASPADVWAVLVDLEGSVDTLSAITKIERLDDGDDFGVGTRWVETRVMFGKEATEEMVVTAVDEGHSYTVEAESRGSHYTSVMSVEPAADGGSTVRMTFGAEQEGVVGKVLAQTLGRAFAGATRKAIQQDLVEIGAAAEARST